MDRDYKSQQERIVHFEKEIHVYQTNITEMQTKFTSSEDYYKKTSQTHRDIQQRLDETVKENTSLKGEIL